jgi:hypothetical protein
MRNREPRGQTLPMMTPKHLYAQAVLSGAMTKAAAFTRFINAKHHNPSQGAYRMEQTQSMQKLLADVREELALTESIRKKQLLMTERSLDILNSLLDGGEKKTVQERLATLRLVKGLACSIEGRSAIADDGGAITPAPYKGLDSAGIIS